MVSGESASGSHPLATPIINHLDLRVVCHEIKAEDTISLRHSVLWPTMPQSHVILPEDQNGIHLGAFIASIEHPIAVISLFLESVNVLPQTEDPPRTAPGHGELLHARFRKFACDPVWQGRGVGSELLRAAFEWMKEKRGCKLIWCDARTSASAWYIKRGMKPFGDKFYKGPIEYTRMYAEL